MIYKGLNDKVYLLEALKGLETFMKRKNLLQDFKHFRVKETH